jgi:uncharacterized membrane protein
MSPGVNDPFTAINCLHWMEAGLARMAPDDDGLHVFSVERVAAEPISFERLLSRTLGDCVAYTVNDALTRETLLQVLSRLAYLASDSNRKPIVDLMETIKSEA